VGGKSRYLKYIHSSIPDNYHTFIEPFVGSGAVFLPLQPKRLIINDINEELITSYIVINVPRENQRELANSLKECERKGAKWLITQHATQFITELYFDYYQYHRAVLLVRLARLNGLEEMFLLRIIRL